MDTHVSAVPGTRPSGGPLMDAQDGGSLAWDDDVVDLPRDQAEQRSGIADAIRSLLRRDKIR